MITAVRSSIAKRFFVGRIACSLGFVAETAVVGHFVNACADQNHQAQALLQTSLAFLPIIVTNQMHTKCCGSRARGSCRYNAACGSHFFA